MPLIQSWVTEACARRPDQTAIVWNDERLSYGDLERTTNRLARLLVEAGCRRGDRVAICLPKSPAAYLGIVATLKADCVYVPIDVESPAARVRKIIDSCEPRMVLACSASLPLLNDVFAEGTAPRVAALQAAPLESDRVRSEFGYADLAAASPDPLPYANRPEDAAHILFTSGSTGVPKGVVITHANVQAFVGWANRYFGIDGSDRVSGHAPLHFDLSTFDTYGAFAAGAELHPVPPQTNLLPRALAEFIRSRELTQWFSVPSVLNHLARFDAVRPGDFPSLKRWMWCGEVLPTPALIYGMQRLPHAQFTNLYGPTEATIASSYYTVPACPASETEAIPIGRACDGEELLVLDSRLQEAPVGEIADLYLAGVGLSPGYWRDQAKTDQVFVRRTGPDGREQRVYKTGDLARRREDGCVLFLGRADTQIKSRGYRIELGEIETALSTLPFLRESAVVAIDTDQFETKAICCAFAGRPGEPVTAAAIRGALSAAVPKYMLPERWMEWPELPKNANGKIDRRRLRESFEERRSGSVAAPAVTA